MYWIVLADSAVYRIYSYEQKNKCLTLVREQYHPESRAKSHDLVTDNIGHYNTSTKARGIYASSTDPKENEIEQFLKMFAEQVEAGRINKQYEKFILIAPPKITGMLLKHLSKNTQNLMFKNIQKDYVHMPEHEFKKFLQTQWRELVRHNR